MPLSFNTCKCSVVFSSCWTAMEVSHCELVSLKFKFWRSGENYWMTKTKEQAHWSYKLLPLRSSWCRVLKELKYLAI